VLGGVGKVDGAVLAALALAHSQLAPGQVEVVQQQVFDLARQAALPSR
jgi:hypothetical protein